MPFPSPGDLPNPGIEPRSPTLQADSLPSEPPVKPVKLDKDFLKSYFNVLKNLKRKHEQNEDRNESESVSHSVMSDTLQPLGL